MANRRFNRSEILRVGDGLEAPPPPRTGSDADASELFEILLAAQNGQLDPRQRPRRGIRSRRALPVEVTWGGTARRGVTLDVGEGGFAALLAEAPPRDGRPAVTLFLSRREQVSCVARVTAARERRGSARVSFAFEEMAPSDVTRLRAALVDHAVAELAVTPLPR